MLLPVTCGAGIHNGLVFRSKESFFSVGEACKWTSDSLIGFSICN